MKKSYHRNYTITELLKLSTKINQYLYSGNVINYCKVIYNYLEKEWQPTPVFLPGESHRHRSLTGYIHGVTGVGHNLVTKTKSII